MGPANSEIRAWVPGGRVATSLNYPPIENYVTPVSEAQARFFSPDFKNKPHGLSGLGPLL